MNEHRLSNEVLNAFVDGELDAGERLHVLRLSEDQENVRARICETRNLKDLVKNAYEHLPAADWTKYPARRDRGRVRAWGMTAAVGVLCLAAGLVGGRMLPNEGSASLADQDPVFLEIDEVFSLEEAKVAHQGKASNIVLHLATNNRHRIEDALNKIETFLDAQHDTVHPVSVEIVANGYGLDLIRVAQTPYEQKIKSLARDDYLTILACRQAVETLRRNGVNVDLIPEADFAPSALDRIIQRLREGWVYVKV